MFYLLLVPALLLLAYELRHMLRLRKHDRVLFRICHIRSKLLRLLMDEVEAGKMTADDYLYGRWMMASMSQTVTLYGAYKRRLFNFRAFLRFVHRYAKSSKDLLEVPRSGHEGLVAIERELGQALLEGFLTYTPYIRTEFALKMLHGSMYVLARLGAKAVARQLQSLQDDIRVIRTQAMMFGHPELLRTA